MFGEPQLIKLRIDQLQFDKTNPNKLNKEQMQALQKSMQKFGYLTPIVVDQNNMIADGEHRALVYKEQGLQEIPAFRLDLNSDVERRMLRQVMNKLHGEHEKQLDSQELAFIFKENKLDELTQLIAQDKEDLQRLILRYNPGLDFVTAENEADVDRLIDEELKRQVPDTQLGDLYELGNHRLICADCSDRRSVDRVLDGNTVDMLLTDPPYGVDYSAKNDFLNALDKGNCIQTDIHNDSIEDYREFFTKFLQPIPFSEYNTCYIFMSGKELHSLRLATEDAGIKWGDYLVWIKNNHVLGRKDYNARHEFIYYGWKGVHRFYGAFSDTVLEYDKPMVSDLHPVMKPVNLLSRLVRDGSEPGMTIYDPLCGSGSTMIACEQTGRSCRAIEIDPHYCDVIIKRWESYAGQKAVKVV